MCLAKLVGLDNQLLVQGPASTNESATCMARCGCITCLHSCLQRFNWTKRFQIRVRIGDGGGGHSGWDAGREYNNTGWY
jgi:hypothetical protein